MSQVEVRFLGSGDAFGSGGRFQACIHVPSEAVQFLIDCGASSLIAMRRFGVDPSLVDVILLSHLHGDHFGGLPFFILDAQFGRGREKKIKYHLDYRTLMERRAQLDCRRLILTHMSHDMLQRLQQVEVEWAEDGKVVVL